MRSRFLFLAVTFTAALLISQISFAETTHMGVEPNELVSLILVCEIPEGGSTELCDFKRTYMDGPVDPDFFVIPQGKVLIVTEFDWKYINTAEFDLKDQLIEVNFSRLSLSCIANPAFCPKPALKSFATANQFGPTIGGAVFASGNVQMTTGFAIHYVAALYPSVRDMFGNPLTIHGNFAKLQATVRGYLVTATCGIPGAPPCR